MNLVQSFSVGLQHRRLHHWSMRFQTTPSGGRAQGARV